MEKLKGVLIFSGNWINRPWNLIQEDGTAIDLYPLIDAMFLKMKGKPAEHKQERESYSIVLNDSSKFVVEYQTDEFALLKRLDGVGFSNIGAYLPDALIRFSGRKVEIEISDAGLKIETDKSEKVFGVTLSEKGNDARISSEDIRAVCKVGTSDCCIFVAADPDGFTCEKFGSRAAHLLGRHFKGVMRASRVGNCALVGREEESVATV